MAIYIVFDVETPNSANNRMSAIGISAIKDNKIVANYFSLVDPETHFDYFNTQLTGIDSEKVKDAPNFAELWKKIMLSLTWVSCVPACKVMASHGKRLRNTCVRFRSADWFFLI